MNKSKLFFTIIISMFLCLGIKDVYAFSSSNYQNRSLCGNYEVAGFHTDGVIDKVACFSDYASAKNFMKSNGASDLAIMTKVNGKTKIIDANAALVDLTVSPSDLTYYYRSPGGASYTYMNNKGSYGGVDGVLLETSNYNGNWWIKVEINDCKAWISQNDYELVPTTWVKQPSTYNITSDSIRHNYSSKLQSGSIIGGSTIGPKPTMLSTGTYYSYDGHYFYNSITTLAKDYKNNNHNNAVNKNNPYYNYYQYLSTHTKTNYSSININEYIRNGMGIKQDAYGNASSNGSSRLYGMGTFFYYAQEKYGVNAVLSLSLSRNETGNGRSNLAINKNNGFGLNAVDSNPTQAANWYATFSSSILGFANKWVTYGYANPTDWRYFGPQFGNKYIGMNVKYASDVYWSEKMAANYYTLDKYFGLQDYNYYQLGVVNGPTKAYLDASTSSKFIYEYPEREDALVIVGEKTVNNTLWYKVISDKNLSNGNIVGSGNYNWNSYVWVQASQVRKINNATYHSIDNITNFKDKNYTYDLYIENTVLKPKVAISIKDTPYYYDSTLTSKKGQTLKNNRYVMVFSAAYSNNSPVAYLVTSDYKFDQKHWVAADSIRFTNTAYGKASVTASGNQYTWVNSTTEDTQATLISGLYHNSYVPVLEKKTVSGHTWLKVPVDISGTTNEFGWTLQTAPNVSITLSQSVVEDQVPTITANNKTIEVGDSFDPLKDVTAYDNEDGNITNKIKVTENNVNTQVQGNYKVTYSVTDTKNHTTTKSITVTVVLNEVPVINANDKELIVGDNFNPKENVTATDKEDGDLTNKIEVTENTVNTKVVGQYKVTYKVTDSKKQTTTKTIKVTVKEKVVEEEPNTNDPQQVESDFLLYELSFNKNTKKFTISGYSILLDVDNSKTPKYEVILKDKNSDKEYSVEVSSWTSNYPHELGNENNYNNSWYKGELTLDNIPNGDYDLYFKTTKGNHYSKVILDNIYSRPIDRRGEDSKHGYNFKVELKLKTRPVTLQVRDELYTTSTAPTFRNMVNDYDEINFTNTNKLHLIGTSYNYGGTYSNALSITRKLIVENTTSYKQYYYDLNATNQGLYEVQLDDNKDKSYAWFDTDVDITNLPVGTYSISIYTKTSDVADYGELSDYFGILPNTTKTINNKKYTVKTNKSKNNRIEIIVE